MTDKEREAAARGEKLIPVDGRAQLIEMLQVADPAFREKILRQIAGRDPRLARELRMALGH